MAPKGHTPSDEYNSLRSELAEGKKYIFERPLFIIILVIAGVNLVAGSYAGLLLPAAIGLLWFNLWFTIDRLHRLGRLAAYLQLELEEGRFTPWLGWETSLRYYRIWMKANRDHLAELLAGKIDPETAPEEAGCYPAVYILHLAAVLLALLSSGWVWVTRMNAANTAWFGVSSLLALFFAVYAVRSRPDKMKFTCEQARVIWIEVFKDLKKQGIKKSKNSGR